MMAAHRTVCKVVDGIYAHGANGDQTMAMCEKLRRGTIGRRWTRSGLVVQVRSRMWKQGQVSVRYGGSLYYCYGVIVFTLTGRETGVIVWKPRLVALARLNRKGSRIGPLAGVRSEFGNPRPYFVPIRISGDMRMTATQTHHDCEARQAIY